MMGRGSKVDRRETDKEKKGKACDEEDRKTDRQEVKRRRCGGRRSGEGGGGGGGAVTTQSLLRLKVALYHGELLFPNHNFGFL